MKKLIIALIFFASATAWAQTHSLAKLWESDTVLTTPECVLYSPKENVLYVSCINGGPSAENKGSFIAKIGLDGKVKTLKFSENLNSTKGMALGKDKLYVTEIAKLVEIDLKTGKVLKKHDVEGAAFLNDIAVDDKGVVYFTDTRANKLLMLEKDKISVVQEGGVLKSPNGIYFEKGMILIGNGDGKILKYNPKTKQFSTFAEGMGGIDGLKPDGNNGYLASEWRGKIWHISSDGKTTLLHDSVEQKINTADFEYIPAKKTLYVPTFFYNRVVAFELK
jgi:sugar lactone lactonase YvrE